VNISVDTVENFEEREESSSSTTAESSAEEFSDVVTEEMGRDLGRSLVCVGFEDMM